MDDKTAEPCGKCSNCISGDIYEGLSLSFEFQEKAAEYIDAFILKIEPRKKFPNGSFIESCYRAEEGICLSKYGDPGYGELVKNDKYSHGQKFDYRLVAKSVKVLRDFIVENNITAITNVPSLRSDLVSDFSKRLARALNINYIELIEKTVAKPQKEMENSSHQFANAWNSFSVKTRPNFENVLLVDDIVDSRWTLTICAYKLRESGSGKVYPFVLADSSSKE